MKPTKTTIIILSFIAVSTAGMFLINKRAQKHAIWKHKADSIRKVDSQERVWLQRRIISKRTYDSVKAIDSVRYIAFQNWLDTFHKTDFIGNWYSVGTNAFPSRVMTIGADSTDFEVCGNQLGLLCRNVYKHDTLLLYIINIDCGRLFFGPPFYYPPKEKSLFAKCYLEDNELNIIYTQKLFRTHRDEFELATSLVWDSTLGPNAGE